jgi:hypothetical protein
MKTHLPPVQYARFNAFGKDCVDYCVERFGNTPTHEQIRVVVEAVVRRHYPQLHPPGAMGDQETVMNLMSDTESARDYLDWWSAGKNIFLFSEDLVSAFLRTDVEEVPTKLLKSPYRVLYFKFGHHTPIQTVPGNKDRFLDGAYVSSYHGGLTVTCSQCSADGEIGSTGASFFIDLAHCEDIGDALARGLKQQSDDIQHPYDPKLGTANDFLQDTEGSRRAVFEHYLPIAREAVY